MPIPGKLPDCLVKQFTVTDNMLSFFYETSHFGNARALYNGVMQRVKNLLVESDPKVEKPKRRDVDLFEGQLVRCT